MVSHSRLSSTPSNKSSRYGRPNEASFFPAIISYLLHVMVNPGWGENLGEPIPRRVGERGWDLRVRVEFVVLKYMRGILKGEGSEG